MSQGGEWEIYSAEKGKHISDPLNIAGIHPKIKESLPFFLKSCFIGAGLWV